MKSKLFGKLEGVASATTFIQIASQVAVDCIDQVTTSIFVTPLIIFVV